MKNIEKVLEIEALTENISKRFASSNLLKIKILYFISQYENMSLGIIVDKLGMKKSNFALMTRELEDEGLIVCKQGEIDRRVRLLYLTERGKAELDDFLAKFNEYFSEDSGEVSKAIEVVCKYLNRKI